MTHSSFHSQQVQGQSAMLWVTFESKVGHNKIDVVQSISPGVWVGMLNIIVQSPGLSSLLLMTLT